MSAGLQPVSLNQSIRDDIIGRITSGEWPPGHRLPFEHEMKGQVPYAFVVLRAGLGATAEELKNYALAHGPAFRHPRRVFFLDRMPLAGTNKIDKRVLAKQIPTGGEI